MLAGQTLGGRYDVLELIASGGMGEVYRARDRELDELVALKVIRTDRSDPAMVERFRSEVKLARRVTHANVARTFELGHAGELIFCTMELVEGETLEQRLARQHRLPVAEAINIACAVCDALIAAHAARVVHRDIKPANVLIANDGRVVLADFGIASARVVDDGDPSGTPAYMAPEQARGEPATPATDVYAVGLVLYEMLTGQRAFSGTLAQIADDKQQVVRLVPHGGDVSSELAAVVGQATASTIADRIPTAAALREALAPWATADLRAPQPPHRASSPVLEQDRTVVLVAPRASTATSYIANEIHEQLLALLGGGTLRVIPRSDETIPPARLVVRFDFATTELGETLIVKISAGEVLQLTLGFPLAIHQVPRAVAITAAAIQTAVGDTAVRRPEIEAAHDLLLRARHFARAGAMATTEALVIAEQAAAILPEDPRVQALLAILLSRVAFFTADADGSITRRAAAQVRSALASGSGLADAHLAAGHHELHVGDATIAAAHYRVAIARAPYLAEAHEHLGRVLVEAGYLDAAFARFAEAAAIAPHYHNTQWEVARALALEDRWSEADRFLQQSTGPVHLIAHARAAWWRGDVARLREVRTSILASLPFERALFEGVARVFVDDAWSEVGEMLIARALDTRSPSRRRRVFLTQLVAEAACHAGETAVGLQLLEHATEQGLFDLHWLAKAPPLASVRGLPGFAPILARVEARARAIYDALYGDHAVATGATQLATT